MDLREYRLLCKAQELKNIDQQFWIHLQAFANNKAGLRDKKGKLIYNKFDKLFDYEEALSGKDNKRKAKPSNPRVEIYKEFMRKKGEGNDN
ncbi:hypothetical protein [Ileibacterium valens]|uniref:hypothetical protein n=1 Tax=Ileibacterium valens TaxID=1862668 RepID=UPI0024BA66CF|nr:hypothetical protein [Ileibacterium valens]